MSHSQKSRRFKVTAAITVAVFFHVTLTLSFGSAGAIGVREAAATSPKGDSDLPAVFILDFQRGGDYVRSSALTSVERYYRTLMSMNSSVRLVTHIVKPAEEVQAKRPAARKKPLQQHKDLEKADKALWKAKEQLEKKKWGPAGRNLSQAVKLYNRRIDLLEDLDKMVEAQLLLALVRFAQGFVDDGEEALARVLVLRPDLIVDRRWQAPEFKKSLAHLKEGLFSVPTGTIKVTCPFSRACKIYVDGRVKGTGGASVEGLARGHHYIRVVGDGYKPWAKKVHTPARGETRIVAARNHALPRPKRVLTRREKVRSGKLVTPAVLVGFVEEGDFSNKFNGLAGRFCEQAGVDFLSMGFVNRVGSSYLVVSYLYSAEHHYVAEVASSLIEMDASDLQVKLLSFEEKVTMAVAGFPRQKVRGTPAAYAVWKAPAPVVANAPPAPRTKRGRARQRVSNRVGNALKAPTSATGVPTPRPVAAKQTPTRTPTKVAPAPPVLSARAARAARIADRRAARVARAAERRAKRAARRNRRHRKPRTRSRQGHSKPATVVAKAPQPAPVVKPVVLTPYTPRAVTPAPAVAAAKPAVYHPAVVQAPAVVTPTPVAQPAPVAVAPPSPTPVTVAPPSPAPVYPPQPVTPPAAPPYPQQKPTGQYAQNPQPYRAPSRTWQPPAPIPGQYRQTPTQPNGQYRPAPAQYGQQRPGQYAQPTGQYGQPQPGQYRQPPVQYGQPQPGQYRQPPVRYGQQPAGQYQPPPAQYGQPPVQYGQSPGQYGQQPGQYPQPAVQQPGQYPQPPVQYGQQPVQYPPPTAQAPGQYPQPSAQYGQQPGQYPQPIAAPAAPAGTRYAGASPEASVPFTVLQRSAAPAVAAPSVLRRPDYVPLDVDEVAWYQQWWVWTLIGVAVAGGVTAGLILGLPPAEGPPEGFTATVRME